MKLNLKPLKKFGKSISKFIKKHRKAIIITSAFLVALGAAILLFFSLHDNSVTRTNPNASAKKAEPAIVFVASPLTGIDVSPDLAKRPVIAVIVENSPDARPQSGLDKAGVVYEAVAEGGITRFVAIHQEQMADKIGPVRSLRPYFIDIGMGFDAGIAHVGGSPQALSEIRTMGGRDLDQFANGGSYWRSSDRWAPHNVYTSGELLTALMESKGFNSSDYAPWPRKKDAPLETPTATKISLNPSSSLYAVDYAYSPSSNSYNRFIANQPHKDKETTKQLHPKVVIAIKAPQSVIDSSGHMAINLVGSGQAWVFQDGGVTQGKWKKTSRTTNMSFVDSEGKPIKLNAGQTWVTILAPDKAVEYGL